MNTPHNFNASPPRCEQRAETPGTMRFCVCFASQYKYKIAYNIFARLLVFFRCCNAAAMTNNAIDSYENNIEHIT